MTAARQGQLREAAWALPTVAHRRRHSCTLGYCNNNRLCHRASDCVSWLNLVRAVLAANSDNLARRKLFVVVWAAKTRGSLPTCGACRITTSCFVLTRPGCLSVVWNAFMA